MMLTTTITTTTTTTWKSSKLSRETRLPALTTTTAMNEFSNRGANGRDGEIDPNALRTRKAVHGGTLHSKISLFHRVFAEEALVVVRILVDADDGEFRGAPFALLSLLLFLHLPLSRLGNRGFFAGRRRTRLRLPPER